jgi:DNA-binding LytR/AlgR family response regulator
VRKGKGVVNSRTVSSTLRDLRLHLGQPKVAAVMAAVAVILGLSGPFDTWATQSLPVRLLYWAMVVWLTYGAGFCVTRALQPALGHLPVAVQSAATALAVSLAVFAALAVLNLAFGQAPRTVDESLRSLGIILVICLVIDVGLRVLAAQPAAAAPLIPPDGPPPLLDRLPLEKRGGLVSLSVQDHYVNVSTTRGREMILMRLGDAIRETAPVRGLQVHRSHWVALAAVTSARRRGDGAELTLADGQTVPVSRAFLPAIRAAGLLPRKAA